MFLLVIDGISATQWVLLGLILVLIILYPVFTFYKNKKEKEKFDNLSKDLKVGDKILTSSGTYGEIVSIIEKQYGKVLTIKTGDEKNFGFMAVDILTVYSVFRKQEENKDLEEQMLDKPEKPEKPAEKPEKPAEKKEKTEKPAEKKEKTEKPAEKPAEKPVEKKEKPEKPKTQSKPKTATKKAPATKKASASKKVNKKK